MVGYFGQKLRAKMGSLQSFFAQIPPKTLKEKLGRMAGSSELCFGHMVDMGHESSKVFFFLGFPISLSLNEDSNLQYFSKEKFHLKIFFGGISGPNLVCESSPSTNSWCQKHSFQLLKGAEILEKSFCRKT